MVPGGDGSELDMAEGGRFGYGESCGPVCSRCKMSVKNEGEGDGFFGIFVAAWLGRHLSGAIP